MTFPIANFTHDGHPNVLLIPKPEIMSYLHATDGEMLGLSCVGI